MGSVRQAASPDWRAHKSKELPCFPGKHTPCFTQCTEFIFSRCRTLLIYLEWASLHFQPINVSTLLGTAVLCTLFGCAFALGRATWSLLLQSRQRSSQLLSSRSVAPKTSGTSPCLLSLLSFPLFSPTWFVTILVHCVFSCSCRADYEELKNQKEKAEENTIFSLQKKKGYAAEKKQVGFGTFRARLCKACF